MTTATITPAPNKGPRQQFIDLSATIRRFAQALFSAHGGWLVARETRYNNAAVAAAERQDRTELFSLASRADTHSPSLAAELRYLANR